ncbi:hypothetical protein [Streptomyces sp. NRRL WC-3742]|uniref:hypothetical protein n=1 Tax=Streptomyces sp. NRRL WC-3742 TaxID=1463934 RepID=UPI0004C60682|nr:hypothetical protein [Streptomyces sp. NRRL WC-3742]
MSVPTPSWTRITEGTTGEVLLAVDFPATGRLQADFSELAARLTGGHAFWRSIVAPAEIGITDHDAYLQPWLDDVRAAGLPVRAVFGFCVGGVHAALLAEKIGELQGSKPALILFDPELVDAGTVYWQFAMFVESLHQFLAAEEIEELREAGREAHERITDPGELALVLIERFRAAIALACERTGLDEEFVVEVVEAFTSFMAYLAIADAAEPLPRWAAATALSSSSAENGLSRVRNDILHRDGPFVAEEIAFPGLVHADLLRGDEVAKTVDGLLAAE